MSPGELIRDQLNIRFVKPSVCDRSGWSKTIRLTAIIFSDFLIAFELYPQPAFCLSQTKSKLKFELKTLNELMLALKTETLRAEARTLTP